VIQGGEGDLVPHHFHLGLSDILSRIRPAHYPKNKQQQNKKHPDSEMNNSQKTHNKKQTAGGIYNP